MEITVQNIFRYMEVCTMSTKRHIMLSAYLFERSSGVRVVKRVGHIRVRVVVPNFPPSLFPQRWPPCRDIPFSSLLNLLGDTQNAVYTLHICLQTGCSSPPSTISVFTLRQLKRGDSAEENPGRARVRPKDSGKALGELKKVPWSPR